jgi:molecular chaperone GrpE
MKDDKKKKDVHDSEEVASDAIEEEDLEVATSDVAELEKIKQQVEDFENKYKRAIADYQNLQKRVQDEKTEWIRSANRELLLRILTVLDTLILAYQHTQDKNVQVSVQQFLDVLKSEGVTKIEAVGQEFNPHIMECITTEPGEENKVLEEIRVGFMLNDKVLRPAQVKVGSEKQN